MHLRYVEEDFKEVVLELDKRCFNIFLLLESVCLLSGKLASALDFLAGLDLIRKVANLQDKLVTKGFREGFTAAHEFRERCLAEGLMRVLLELVEEAAGVVGDVSASMADNALGLLEKLVLVAQDLGHLCFLGEEVQADRTGVLLSVGLRVLDLHRQLLKDKLWA